MNESDIGAKCVSLTDEVNTFLATLPNLGDTLDVKYTSYPVMSPSGSQNANLRHVTFVVYVGV